MVVPHFFEAVFQDVAEDCSVACLEEYAWFDVAVRFDTAVESSGAASSEEGGDVFDSLHDRIMASTRNFSPELLARSFVTLAYCGHVLKYRSTLMFDFRPYLISSSLA